MNGGRFNSNRPPFQERLIIKRHLGFPDFPNPAHQIRTGFKRLFSGFPSGRHGLSALGFADVLEGLNLSDAFHHVSADRRGKNFKTLDDAVGVNDESASRFHAGVLQINTEDTADLAAGVGEHGEGNPSLNHPGEFMVVPHLVDKNAVHAHGKNLDAQFLEFGVFLCDRRDFGGSDKGEVTGIETKDDPFA